MRKLTPKNYTIPDLDGFLYDESGEVLEGKEKIDENITTIRTQITSYQTNKFRLENLVPTTYSINTNAHCKRLDETQRTNELYCCLYKLYDSKSNHSKTFKKSIQDISNIKCPYCNIDTPSHLDHYLPRSKFPEYSVLSLNLIYVCSVCNSIYKGDDYVNSNNERLYFNPYFDSFIDTISFLKCDITIDTIYPKFTFSIDENLITTSHYEYKIIKNHFDKLNLKSRYMDQIVEEKFKRFKNRYINRQTQQFKNILLQTLQNDIEYELSGLYDLNINNWEKVFWESLKNSTECLNLIVNKEININ